MATRALVESSIDAFWSSAGTARPDVPQDLIRRNQTGRKSGGGSKSARGYPPTIGRGYPPSGSQSARGPERKAPASGAQFKPDPEHAKFRSVTVELSGREGYNAIAVNGIWRFWRVKGSRLAFSRDVELQVEENNVEEEGCSDDSAGACASAVATQGGDNHSGVATVRLYLFYMPQVDSWLISDSQDSAGSVTADCGPVGSGEDLGNDWRIWDGERWCQDRNITAEVALGGVGFPNLKGLRVSTLPALQNTTRQRALSHEPSGAVPRAPSCDRPQDLSTRPRRNKISR